jgi:putative alpha-1,2-mannosidase
MFKKITINLENGKKFVIDAAKNSKENVYIRSATLNGKKYNANFITHSDLVNGGVLKLEMSSVPNENRGLEKADKPFSLSK